MPNTISRRDFLKISGAGVGALVLGQFIPPQVAEAARASGLLDATGSGYIPSMCEMCVWRCGLLAKVENGRVVKLEGNPRAPAFEWQALPARAVRPDEHLRSRPGADAPDPGRQARRRAVPQGLLGGSAGHGRREHARDQEEIWRRGDDVFDHALPQPGPVREPAECLWLAQLRHPAQPVLQRHDRCQPGHLWHAGTRPQIR